MDVEVHCVLGVQLWSVGPVVGPKKEVVDVA